jgi:serine/threonine-protein kinase RsbW
VNEHREERLPVQREALKLRWREKLESNTAAINRAVRDVLKFARATKSVRLDARSEVEIALREALANAVFHGNEGDPRKQVFLRVYGGPDWGLLVVVRDEGPGFDPQSVPDPREGDRLELTHGRGVFLMKELMDYVEWRKRGREVVLFKKRARVRRDGSGRTEPA